MRALFLSVMLGSSAVALAVFVLNSTHIDGWGSMFLAPFAASLMLAVSVPDHPSSSTWAIVAGNLSAATCGLLVGQVMGADGLALPVAAASAFGAMTLLRARHAPAMATAIVCAGAPANIGFLIYPVFSGALAIASVALAARRLRTSIREPSP